MRIAPEFAEKIEELYDNGETNYAKGTHSAFYGYLRERRDYLEFNGYYDKPELPEDADEDDIVLYNEKMESMRYFRDTTEFMPQGRQGLRLFLLL